MNNEIMQLWQELLGDLTTKVVLWQVVVVVIALLTAWLTNGLVKNYIMQYATETWKVGVGGIKRVLFPLTSLLVVAVGELILHQWQHVGLLKLSVKLLWAMAAIRLVVYALRYVFASGSWVRALESLISTTIWALLAMHLTGVLPDIIQALDEVSFHLGKNHVSLLLIIQAIITIFVTIVVALWVSRLIENRLMVTEQINMNVRVLINKIIRIILITLALLMTLSALGLDITLLSVFGGALGVGLGLGLQKIAINYLSGFVILLDNSMNIGDVITADNHYGVVSELRSRYMVLRKLDGTQVIIPHEILISNAVINHSFSDRKSSVQMPIQISYESNLENAMQLMEVVASQHPRVLEEPKPTAVIKGFSESGIDLSLNIWIEIIPETGTTQLQSDIYLQVWREFQQHGISIPYPQREIRMLADPNEQTNTRKPL
jgi:small-conductance mechanosensitive channel